MANIVKTKFLILGVSGSGKTSYLVAMYNKMKSGVGDFRFQTVDDKQDIELTKMHRLAQKQGEHPDGTAKILAPYEFTLRHSHKPVSEFEWLDYKGGILNKEGITDDELNKFKKAVKGSDILCVAVDGSLLKYKNLNACINAVKNECSSVINSFFDEYVDSNQTIPPIAIIITKDDLVHDSLTQKDVNKIIKGAFGSLFTQDVEHEHIVAVLPVQIGNKVFDFADDNKVVAGKLEPLGLHLPIFMGAWCSLRTALKSASESKKKNTKKEVNSKEANLSNTMDNNARKKEENSKKTKFKDVFSKEGNNAVSEILHAEIPLPKLFQNFNSQKKAEDEENKKFMMQNFKRITKILTNNPNSPKEEHIFLTLYRNGVETSFAALAKEVMGG